MKIYCHTKKEKIIYIYEWHVKYIALAMGFLFTEYCFHRSGFQLNTDFRQLLPVGI
jgi:hypothetical protein